MIPQIASLLAPLASEAGKQTIKWGGIAIVVLSFLGAIAFGAYQKKRGDKLEEKVEYEKALKLLAEERVIIIANHTVKQNALWQKRWDEANNATRKQYRLNNTELAKDINKSISHINCVLKHINDIGECKEDKFISLIKE